MIIMHLKCGLTNRAKNPAFASSWWSCALLYSVFSCWISTDYEHAASIASVCGPTFHDVQASVI